MQPSPGGSDLAGVEVGDGLLARPSHQRHPGDVVRLALGLVVLGVGVMIARYAGRTVTGVEADLVALFGRFPERVLDVMVGVVQVAASVVPLAVVAVLVLRRRLRLLALLALAAGLAALVTEVLAATVPDRAGPGGRPAPLGTGILADPTFPSSAFVASAVAAVTVGAPWMTRRWRRAASWGIAVVVLLRLVSTVEPAGDVVAAIGVGLVIGAVVLLAFGSPNLRPTPAQLVGSLRAQGLSPVRLDVAGGGDGAPIAYTVDTDLGDRLLLTVRTPYDRSAEALDRAVRAVRTRSVHEPPTGSLAGQAEHEVLATIEARRAGARVPDPWGVVRIGSSSVGVLLPRVEGTPLDRLEPETVTDELLVRVWGQLDRLRAHDLAHGALGLDRVLVDAFGRPWIVGFDDARLAAGERALDHDVAQLLVALALRVGDERAVDTAVATLGPHAVERALPLLQPLALSPSTRRLLGRGHERVDHLRAVAQARTGAPEVELERIERVKPRTVLSVVAGGMAVAFVLPRLADVGRTVDAFRGADLAWVPVVLVATALTYVFATVSLLGAVPVPVPAMATFRAQVASSFVGRITPASTGGPALNLRLLQRAGIDSPTATAAVGLNTVAGFVVHVALLLGFVVWSGRSDLGGIPAPRGPLLLAIGAGVAVLVVAVALTPFGRRVVLAPVLRFVRSAAGALAAVLVRPSKVTALFGGSTGITVAYLVAFYACVEAFGGGLGVPQVGAAYLGASALAAVAPTPGGLGAFEAAMAAGLNSFGLDQGVAVSAVLTFRLITFWLPLLPGWWAFTDMQRREEL